MRSARGLVLALSLVAPLAGCGLVLGLDPDDPDGGAGMDAGGRDAGGPCTSDADCDDGDLCNGAEVCDVASGECQPGPSMVCPTTSDLCMVAVCDPATGCGFERVNCDDRVGCTLDACDPATGRCTNVTDPNQCPSPDPCTPSVCDTQLNACVSSPLCPGGTTCTDGVCEGTLSCREDLDCIAVAPPCQTGACESGTCRFTTATDGDACMVDACSTGFCEDGACTADGGALSCTATPGSCEVGTCNPATGCTTRPAADGTLCDQDGDPCTQDRCLAGVCERGPRRCLDVGNDCVRVLGCANDGMCLTGLEPLGTPCVSPLGLCGTCDRVCTGLHACGSCPVGTTPCGASGACCGDNEFCSPSGVCVTRHDCLTMGTCGAGEVCCECAAVPCHPGGTVCPACPAGI